MNQVHDTDDTCDMQHMQHTCGLPSASYSIPSASYNVSPLHPVPKTAPCDFSIHAVDRRPEDGGELMLVEAFGLVQVHHMEHHLQGGLEHHQQHKAVPLGRLSHGGPQ